MIEILELLIQIGAIVAAITLGYIFWEGIDRSSNQTIVELKSLNQ